MKHCVLLLCIFLECCGTPASDQPVDTVKKDSPAVEQHNDVFKYDTVIKMDRHGHITREYWLHDTLRSREVFDYPSSDTSYYPDGCIERVSEKSWPSTYYEEKDYFYYHNHILQSEGTVYSHDGMGGAEEDVEYYDSATGRKTEDVYHKDYMPADATDHLDLCGVVTTKTYYSNGYVDSISTVDYHYEGLEYCPCGTWQVYDSTGKLLSQKKYKKCGDGHTNCVEDYAP